MSENEGLPEGIKKIRFLGAFMVAMGGNKGINEKMMLFDFTENEKKHITIMATKGILDIHETVDDKNNEHKSIAKIDLSVFQNMQQSNITREELIEKAGLEEVDITSPEYQNSIAFAPDEHFGNLILKKKEILITPETTWPVCMLSKVREHDYRYVLVFDGDTYKFTVIKMNNKYYKLTDESMTKILEIAMPGFVKAVEKAIQIEQQEPKQ